MGAAIAGPTDHIGLMTRGATPVCHPPEAVAATCGKQVRGDDADKGGGARQFAFGFGDIGTAPQQLDRQAGADTAGQRRKHPRPCQLLAEVFGKLSDQDGDHVAGGVDLGQQGRKLRLQLRQLALGQGHVQLVGDAATEALLDEIDVFLRHLDILA